MESEKDEGDCCDWKVNIFCSCFGSFVFFDYVCLVLCLLLFVMFQFLSVLMGDGLQGDLIYLILLN